MSARWIACTECGTEWETFPVRDDPDHFVCNYCLAADDPNGPGSEEWALLYGHNETLADELP